MESFERTCRQSMQRIETQSSVPFKSNCEVKIGKFFWQSGIEVGVENGIGYLPGVGNGIGYLPGVGNGIGYLPGVGEWDRIFAWSWRMLNQEVGVEKFQKNLRCSRFFNAPFCQLVRLFTLSPFVYHRVHHALLIMRFIMSCSSSGSSCHVHYQKQQDHQQLYTKNTVHHGYMPKQLVIQYLYQENLTY
ncbi:hypothetical protein HELRODRAFT_177664 [Helobdella robusta]|uniref:Uncharacterized protein n=1 Tax=Helobdella robusta TaxID=6412 RepID=T1FC13_HELRO|nr:hypothetical protein HELRODRAFT_177664 [Helobdella robusta]ESN97991.1 hypothetical protein HELRODRAFT_177664 [Helobdella robusta]